MRPAAFGEQGGNVASDAAVDWLLTAESGTATAIDAEHGDGRAWTVGNHVTVHVDGAAYFRAAAPAALRPCRRDWVYLTDWRIDATRQPGRPGQRSSAAAADWHGTGWPSAGFCGAPTPPGPLQPGRQPGAEHAGQPSRRAAGSRPAGAPFGSHQKLVVHLPNDPGRCIAFVGGIDLSAAALTIPTTAATPTPSGSTPATGAGRPGTTCSWSCTARPSSTSTSPSGNGGAAPRWTTATAAGHVAPGEP